MWIMNPAELMIQQLSLDTMIREKRRPHQLVRNEVLLTASAAIARLWWF